MINRGKIDAHKISDAFNKTIFNTTLKHCYTLQSLCEVSTYEQSQKTSRLISYYLKTPPDAVLIETSAGIGGNTNSFANNFKQVYAIEYDKDTHECLVTNMNKHIHENVTAINGDCNELLPSLTMDNKINIVFMDPPWGDMKRKNIELEYGNVKINDLIKKCPLIDLIVIKAPPNTNINKFHTELTRYKYIDVCNVMGKYKLLYKLVFLTNTVPIEQLPENIQVNTANYKKELHNIKNKSNNTRKKKNIKFIPKT